MGAKATESCGGGGVQDVRHRPVGGSGAVGDVGRYQPRRRTHTTNFLVHTTMRAKTMRTERIRAGGMPSAA